MKESKLLRISNLLNLSKQDFSTIEKHVFLLTLLHLKKEQSTDYIEDPNRLLDLEIDILDLKENNRDRIKGALDKLTSRKIFFDNSRGRISEFGYIVPFTSAKYTSIDRVESKIRIKINPDANRLFLDLAKGYTTFDLQAVLNLKSAYAIRLYELLKQYENQKEWVVEVEELRRLLNAQNEVYVNFSNFKTRILDYSINQLWEHCQLHYEWTIFKKKGRKITHIKFKILSKSKQEKVEVNEEVLTTLEFLKTLPQSEINNKFKLIVSKYKFSDDQVNYILTNNELFEKFVQVDLIIEDKISKGKPPKNISAYMAKSLGLDKVKFSKSNQTKLL
jgi:plasmid replication initiation protein